MNNNEEFARLLEKSKQMFATGKELYFDVDEFVNLIAHYIEQEDDDKVQKLFTYAENQHVEH